LQKIESGRFFAPQLPQIFSFVFSTTCFPHLGQNFVPGVMFLPQYRHWAKITCW
jgi:hypothetical protein